MRRLSGFVVNINDIYGRIVPGIILISSAYFIAIRFMDPNEVSKLRDLVLSWQADSLLLFSVAFVLLAYLAGEPPLFFVFLSLRPAFKYRPIEAIQLEDPTRDKEITKSFENTFSADALNKKESTLMSYCTDYVLENSPESHRVLKAMEADVNVKGGVIIPLLAAAFASLVHGYWLAAVVFIIAAAVFFWGFARVLRFEDRAIVRFYYHARTKITGLSGSESPNSDRSRERP